MNEKRAVDFLKQIFFQALRNENFYLTLVKLGVNFSQWPNKNIWAPAKKFYKLATEKSYNSAVIECDVEIPVEAFKDVITEEEIKLYYTQALNFLRALELREKLTATPEAAIQHCNEFLNLNTSTAQKINLRSALATFITENEKKLSENKFDLVLTDFPVLSRLVGGFNPGRIGIVTAHSGFGKTNFGLNFFRAVINDDMKALYVNMEMDTTDMVKRFLQAYCHMRSRDFTSGDYIQKITPVMNKAEKFRNTWITDGSQMSITEISQMVSEIKRSQGLDFVIVDYDQKIIMSALGIRDEWQYLLKAVEMLESLAKKEQVYIMLFAQTNEEKDGVPVASRRSIQPASNVIHFTRENETTLFKFIKNRFGPTNIKIELKYDASQSLITEVGELEEKPSITPPRGFGFRKDLNG